MKVHTGNEDWDDRPARERMVALQLRGRGISDQRVLDAFLRVPRHRFVGEDFRNEAYADHPLPIDAGQTISQPYIVAAMVEALGLSPGSKVLEVGTGCGYETAILAEMGARVYTIEIVAALAEQARMRLESLGRTNIHFRTGDGALGWQEAAPFDGIVVSAAPTQVPDALLHQLGVKGCCVIPVGGASQTLKRIRRVGENWETESLMSVRFVPMTGA